MTEQPKVAIVTGAGTGVGKAVAQILLRNGYCVTLTGRRSKLLEAAASESGADSKVVFCHQTDVRHAEEVDSLFDAAIERFGRIDLLFNNAGIGARAVDVDELEVSEWQAVLETNIHGAFLCARRAFGQMKVQDPKGGRIINNGSISAYVPRVNSAPYTVTKHAISGLTRSLALDGRSHNIACGQIDIGNALTEMAKPLGEGVRQPNGTILAEPLMDVHHVATSVLHMAQLPLDTNVLFMNVMARDMPFVGRG
ncbi:MAG: SDR family oxidoreductase [Proteobacteria bacterium]|jgi:NAD(P)-dependent dehydrogenase (short-subunit alcohol dehydrogenase family)|nr:SDR family oxidoreductase [Pseudomonadota bacterium]MBT5227859.1 SDR family oxidoreductase [Pseudomonadota bacterium]MBT6350161.1 SDR family oxidoreductase [Pseudomonadota bacterium]